MQPANRSREQIASSVEEALASTLVVDMHTHLYAPEFGKIGLWGIDELLTYHYLEAELFRYSEIMPEHYWALSKRQQADAIWRTLFVENTPVSESCRGVIAVLSAFGLPTNSPDLNEARAFFASRSIDDHVRGVFQLAGVRTVVMTNDPLDPEEGPLWMKGVPADPAFLPVLRLDRLLREWSNPWAQLQNQGYKVDDVGSVTSIKEIRRFLSDWHARMQPVYMAVSLPDTFQFPDDTIYGLILREAILPSCREFDIPLSLMIGVRRQVNPRIRLAGDAVGRADLRALENICRDHPDNRFLVSLLSRENQHELCVYARKFSNLLPFGCWWFMNNPSIVEEITRERLEMLGTSFIPQHSDARVLDQLVYKWDHSRKVIGKVLTDKFTDMATAGRPPDEAEIRKTVKLMLSGNFEQFLAG
jgi:hypothetical protein